MYVREPPLYVLEQCVYLAWHTHKLWAATTAAGESALALSACHRLLLPARAAAACNSARNRGHGPQQAPQSVSAADSTRGAPVVVANRSTPSPPVCTGYACIPAGAHNRRNWAVPYVALRSKYSFPNVASAWRDQLCGEPLLGCLLCGMTHSRHGTGSSTVTGSAGQRAPVFGCLVGSLATAPSYGGRGTLQDISETYMTRWHGRQCLPGQPIVNAGGVVLSG